MLAVDGRSLDLDRVAPKLYQGGAVDPSYHYGWFDMIVLCAIELQPELPHFRGEVVRPAFDDTVSPTRLDLTRAAVAADLVAKALHRGKCVLVTCRAGWNRSGLVSGLALGRSMPGAHAVSLIRRARGHYALCNSTFERIVRAAPMQHIDNRGSSVRL